MAYLLVMASRKLRHYFLAHDIMVLTSYPLGDMLRNKEATGRIDKWAVELASFTISFVSQSAIKSQILADFIVERTRPCSDQPEPPVEEVWIARTDGACNAFGASFAISFISRSAITSPIGRSASFAARLEFPTTNNTAEYEAIMLALRKARAMGAQTRRLSPGILTSHIKLAARSSPSTWKRFARPRLAFGASQCPESPGPR